jgi:hypothetical protein
MPAVAPGTAEGSGSLSTSVAATAGPLIGGVLVDTPKPLSTLSGDKRL